MRGKSFFTVMVGCVAVAIPLSFAPLSSPTVSFTGVWRHIEDSSIPEDREEQMVLVEATGDLFRIENGGMEFLYDGTMLYSRVKEMPVLLNGLRNAEEAAAVAQEIFALDRRSATREEVCEYRFWADSRGMTVGPGEPIAGRATMIRERSTRWKDGKCTVRSWVDADTKIVLRSVFTVQSDQTHKIILKQIRECLSIRYERVDPRVFHAPAGAPSASDFRQWKENFITDPSRLDKNFYIFYNIPMKKTRSAQQETPHYG
jgi:hypothetical protein